MVVVDVSDPRPNVLYELGVTCSLRSNDSVVITKHTSSTFNCSEVQQLQILYYDCLHDLTAKIKQHFRAVSWPIDRELSETFLHLHNKLNYKARKLLFTISELHQERLSPTGSGSWHISFSNDEPLEQATELVELGLVKWEYDRATQQGKLAEPCIQLNLGKDTWNRTILGGSCIQTHLKAHNNANAAVAKSRAAD